MESPGFQLYGLPSLSLSLSLPPLAEDRRQKTFACKYSLERLPVCIDESKEARVFL
jgi:hypothetical protein